MAQVRKLLAHFGGHAILDFNVAADIEIAAYGETSGLHGSLKIHAIIDHIGHELGVREWLVGAAHDAKPDVVVAALHEGRNDGVERALVTGERVRLGRVQHKQGSAILQRESQTSYRDARAKT